MDTSKEYIKMCDCEEIQGQKSYSYRVDSINLPWYDSSGNCWFNDNNDKTIWLPRQDQLQEMVKETKFLLSDGEWAYRFGQWCFAQLPQITKTSMEQLWLAFVMWELHQKRWEGAKWINKKR